MTQSKHTPVFEPTDNEIMENLHARGDEIATMGAERIERLKAINAELLEALKHLLYRYEYDRPRDDAGSQQARAAIAKATQG